MMRWWPFLLAAVACGDPPASPPPVDPRHAELSRALDERRAALELPGAVIAARAPDMPDWVGASGFADPEGEQRMQPGDLFGIGSVTKTFTAAAILSLRDQGLLALDDPLSLHCPECPHADQITIEQLLRHTSGFGDYLLAIPIAQWTEPWAPLDLVALAERDAGAGWRYANTNYILLGIVAERAGGRSWEQQVGELIDRAALSDTYLPSVDEVPPTARGHSYHQAADVLFHPSVGWSAGSMVASAHDALRWLDALLGGAIVPAGTVAEMMAPSAASPSYGLGLYVIGDEVGHDGDAVNFRSEVFCKLGRCVAALANDSPADIAALADAAWTILDAP